MYTAVDVEGTVVVPEIKKKVLAHVGKEREMAAASNTDTFCVCIIYIESYKVNISSKAKENYTA